MRKIIFVLCIIYFFPFASISYAVTYYVSTHGNDSNPGTSALPWKTLNKAISKVDDNDDIIIKSGDYLITDRIEIDHKKGITITGESAIATKIIYSGTDDEYALGFGVNANAIILRDLQLIWKSSNNGNVVGVGGSDITIKNCEIYFDTSSHVDKYDCIKILASASNVLVENCKIYGAPNQGIDAVGATNITIRNNRIFDCQNGIVLKGGAKQSLIEKNIVFNHIYGAIGLGGTTGAQWNSEDYEIADSTVRENVIYYDNPNNVGGGIFLMGAIRCKVYNNTVYGPGIHIKNGGTPDKLQTISENNIVANNIIWRTGNDGILVIENYNEGKILLANNCYWKTTGSGEFKINGKWYPYSKFKNNFKNENKGSFLQAPNLKDVVTHDFTLATSSPCVNGEMVSVDGIPVYKYLGAVAPRDRNLHGPAISGIN
ncbi:MAG: right-handed parallel beta-helix repeat-containing protein [Clostridiales bacterium]|nr:right-handed parallel beta-helix repeat-containing protein [Clostridiales bacterium]